MPLDRQSIEKRDFPIGRRGYDPDAVDAHLARLAEEIEDLRRASEQPRTPESLAAVASHQVAAIVQAAESSAAEIERDARDDAEQIRRDAEADASSTRAEAVQRSREHVSHVSEATSVMLQRIEAMEQEIGALTESLRTGTSRLQADLSLLQSNMDEVYSAPAPQRVDAVAESARSREVEPPARPPSTPAPMTAQVGAQAAPESRVRGAEEEIAPEATPSGGPDEDVEGARLIALNMALNGTSREETDRYLAENFDLSDRQGLLDEVYSSVD
jgi:DivIVA domain-containing protein